MFTVRSLAIVRTDLTAMKYRNSFILTLVIGLLTLSAAVLAAGDQAPATPTTVSVSANNTDVRTVLRDLFAQTKQNT